MNLSMKLLKKPKKVICIGVIGQSISLCDEIEEWSNYFFHSVVITITVN